MSQATAVYEYEFLYNPTQEQINALGAQGYRLHSFQLDPRDGSLAYAAMERINGAVLVEAEEELIEEHKMPPSQRRGKR